MMTSTTCLMDDVGNGEIMVAAVSPQRMHGVHIIGERGALLLVATTRTKYGLKSALRVTVRQVRDDETTQGEKRY